MAKKATTSFVCEQSHVVHAYRYEGPSLMASCLTHRELKEVHGRILPPTPHPRGAEECASSHRVHRLLVTFPYASEVGTLITSACDSRGGEEEK